MAEEIEYGNIIAYAAGQQVKLCNHFAFDNCKLLSLPKTSITQAQPSLVLRCQLCELEWDIYFACWNVAWFTESGESQ